MFQDRDENILTRRRRFLCLGGTAGVTALSGCIFLFDSSKADFHGSVTNGQIVDSEEHEVELAEGDSIRIEMEDGVEWLIEGPTGKSFVGGNATEYEIYRELPESRSENSTVYSPEKIEVGEFRYTVPIDGTYTINMSADLNDKGDYWIYVNEKQ